MIKELCHDEAILSQRCEVATVEDESVARDLIGFMGVVPGIFQRTNFYAIAAIAGSTSYVCLVMSGIMSNVAALVVCVVVTMGLRWLSLRFDIKSPTEEDIARFLHRKK